MRNRILILCIMFTIIVSLLHVFLVNNKNQKIEEYLVQKTKKLEMIYKDIENRAYIDKYLKTDSKIYDYKNINRLINKNPKIAKELQSIKLGNSISVYDDMQDKVITFIPIKNNDAKYLNKFLAIKSESNYIIHKTLSAYYTFIIGVLITIIIFIMNFIYEQFNAKEIIKNINTKLESEMLKVANESSKVHHLNVTLANRVREEVEKNRIKDQQVFQQSRLAQMGEMISMIAHQWRQPLGAINNAVMAVQFELMENELNLEKNKTKDKLLSFISSKNSNISEYVKFLSNTIDDFRNLYKPDKEKSLVNISTPIQKALQIIGSSLEGNNIVVHKDIKINDEVALYQNEIMQVILNILKNCEDNFLDKKIKSAEISIVTTKKDDKLMITISDNGGGISDNILPKIFDPYFSTKDEKNGTGLGLYMSKVIVEEHNNGTLNVYNTKSGTCFEIVLKG